MTEISQIDGINGNGLASYVDAQQIFQSLPDPVYTCDLVGNITSYNKAALAIWERAPEKDKDLWCGAFKLYTSDGDTISAELSPMAQSIKDQRAIEIENILIEKPSGLIAHYSLHSTLLHNDLGEFSGAIFMLRYLDKNIMSSVDVKIWQNSIGESEQLFRKMIEEVEDYAIVLLDKGGTIINWNKGAEKIKGYSEDEILGKNFKIFYLPKDREEKLPEQLIQQAFDQGKAMHEGWRLRSDGSTFWGYIVITAVHDLSNQVIGFTKVTRDLTERKIAEDRMLLYAKDIEEQNKQLENYAQIASHDLQEPIRKIQLFAGLLESHIDDKEAVKKNIHKIISSAERMSNLIKDVLNYSHVAKVDELFSDIDLNKVLDAAKEDLDLIIFERGAQITLAAPLPTISGLAIQLNQLFYNLIGNAIKFCAGQPLIEISWQKALQEQINLIPHLDGNSQFIELKFKDNGFGFEQQYAEQAFKMFRRLNNVTSGTGIGLAVCKKVVENHHGDISVFSALGKGSTFVIYLPM